jgi:iron(III) transport system ATP-binding protein
MTDLVVEGVEKWLGGIKILKGASFSAERGSIAALLGASGSGKTTLLRCVAGLEQPEKGTIRIAGQTVFDPEAGISVPPERRLIGLVFQSYALWPHKTVFDNVAYSLKLRKVARSEIATRVTQTLERMGLGHLAERYPDQLSGGQQQRVAICRSLVYEPRVLLFDEPLSNLDAKLREEARFWIRKLILELGLCAVVVTHDQGEALAMSDRVLLLKDGEIVQEGSPVEIYNRPKTRFTAEFLGMNNVVAGDIAMAGDGRAMIQGDGWSLDGKAMGDSARGRSGSGRGAAVIRTERVRLAEGPGANRLQMKLEAIIYLGDRWEYRLRAGDLQLRAQGDEPVDAERVWCECRPEHVWIFPDEPSPVVLGSNSGKA